MAPVDQRQIETSRLKVPGTEGADPRPQADPNEETDPSQARLADAASVPPSQWRLNALGAVLGTALVCALLLAVGLWVKLQRTRVDLAEAELAAEMAEAALAREPGADEKPKAAPERNPAPETEAVDLTGAAARAAQQAGAAPDEQLVLLLTVGTQHYAEKQLRTLRKRCKAPLHVYQQRRGRCAWSQCWAVAAPAEERDLARDCGAVKGQALRDRKDFLQLP